MFCKVVIPVCCNVTCISSQNNLWPFSWYLNTSWGMLLMLQVTWHFLFINTHTHPPPSGYFGQSAALFTEVAMTSRKNASHWPDLEAFLPVLSITLCVCAFSPHTSIFASIPTVLHSDETQQQCHQFSFSHFWFLWKCSFWSHWITNLKKVCQWAKNHRESLWLKPNINEDITVWITELIRVRMVGYQCCCTVLVWFFAVMFSPLFQEN